VIGSTVDCTISVFGDPLPGFRKSCFCDTKASLTDSTFDDKMVQAAPQFGSDKCANENGQCSCETKIIYGNEKNGILDQSVPFLK
jgi:hypothetical protein